MQLKIMQTKSCHPRSSSMTMFIQLTACSHHPAGFLPDGGEYCDFAGTRTYYDAVVELGKEEGAVQGISRSFRFHFCDAWIVGSSYFCKFSFRDVMCSVHAHRIRFGGYGDLRFACCVQASEIRTLRLLCRACRIVIKERPASHEFTGIWR